MRIQNIVYIWMLFSSVSALAQNESPTPTSDSLYIALPEVNVSESHSQRRKQRNTLPTEVAAEEYLRQNFTGNLVQTLNRIPGIQSMDIGSGFSKPMIRGLGFNRISFIENGIKQEGQQWGADHGLETDPFNAEQVIISKGPSSLLYGSDTMGGAIELQQAVPPIDNSFLGEVSLLGKSVNSSLGGSLMLAIKKNNWYGKVRYSEQHYADYRLPTDTIVYLTQKIPIHNRRLKNTAGFERDIHALTQYAKDRYRITYNLSNVYQKTGFFPGAHGIPDPSQVEDDGDSRNIDLPYSRVNHFKTSLHQQYVWDNMKGEWNIGYQNNHREEWSLFHTHYSSQPKPETDPDKELEFELQTYSSTLKATTLEMGNWELAASWDIQYQENKIDGYSFLIPEYKRFTTGGAFLTTWKVSSQLSFSGGIRYDYGQLDIESFDDPYLAIYLTEQGYDEAIVEEYRMRSGALNRHFGDYSCSVGMVWKLSDNQLLKANIGRSFRLPGANELTSNGMHHGTFRHEQGDPTLKSENGWQLDAAYSYENKRFSVQVSPFASWFSNYIYLKPTGEWSVLPHTGQIYKFTGAEAIFAGGEVSVSINLYRKLYYELNGEYVYTYNRDEKTALSFSPPASCSNALVWKTNRLRAQVEYQYIASQKRVARNEDTTPGAGLIHAMVDFRLPIHKTDVEITLSARNLLNKRYYNHLSFYRKVEIPEPGRNFQLLIKIPFKTKL